MAKGNIVDFKEAKLKNHAREFQKLLVSKPCLLCGSKSSFYSPYEFIDHGTGKRGVVVSSICKECSEMPGAQEALQRATANSMGNETIEWFGRL